MDEEVMSGEVGTVDVVQIDAESIVTNSLNPEVGAIPVQDARVEELERHNAALQEENTRLHNLVNEQQVKIERLRAAKNAYRKMAGYASNDMRGAHLQGDIYASRRVLELSVEFNAIKDEE